MVYMGYKQQPGISYNDCMFLNANPFPLCSPSGSTWQVLARLLWRVCSDPPSGNIVLRKGFARLNEGFFQELPKHPHGRDSLKLNCKDKRILEIQTSVCT